MKIYTKTGDSGSTGLFGGARVDKDDARVNTYGTVDETNAAIGAARSAGLVPAIDEVLREVQSDLFTLGAQQSATLAPNPTPTRQQTQAEVTL